MANLIENIEIQSRLLKECVLLQLISLAMPNDLNCKGEASRVIANLAANAEIQQILIWEGALNPMVEALEKDEVNFQMFAALCITNLSRTVSSYVKFILSNTLHPLVYLAIKPQNKLKARQYATLALANLAVTQENHLAVLEDGGLQQTQHQMDADGQ